MRRLEEISTLQKIDSEIEEHEGKSNKEAYLKFFIHDANLLNPLALYSL